MYSSEDNSHNLPIINPSDWINIYYILVLKSDETLQPHIDHFQLMMQNYMWELAKFHVVATGIMRGTPHVVEPNFVDFGINSDGLILFEPSSVIVKITLNGVTKFNRLDMK